MSNVDSIGTDETSFYDSVRFDLYSEDPAIRTDYETFDQESLSVTLSDGSNWEVIKDKQDETTQKIIALWKKGDDIRIKALTIKDETYFALKNVRTNDLVITKLSKECADLSKAFFVSKVDPSGYAFETKDGRIWVAGFLGHFSVRRWKEGDRLVINQSTHSDQDYEIIHSESHASIHVTNVFQKA